MSKKPKSPKIFELKPQPKTLCSKIYPWGKLDGLEREVPNGYKRLCLLHDAWHLRAGRNGDCWVSYNQYNDYCYGDVITIDLQDGTFYNFHINSGTINLNSGVINIILLARMMAKNHDIMEHAVLHGINSEFYQMIEKEYKIYKKEWKKRKNVINLHSGYVFITPSDSDPNDDSS